MSFQQRITDAALLVTALALMSACTTPPDQPTTAMSPTSNEDPPEATISIVLLDGSQLDLRGPLADLELSGYQFTLSLPEIRSTNVELFRATDPVGATSVDPAAVLESDLGGGVRLWRADREGQPIFMSVDLDGWSAILHVANETAPHSEDLVPLANDLKGIASSLGVELPALDLDRFTAYLDSDHSENSIHLGIGQCHGEVVPGAQESEDPVRGRIIEGPGYASWCDPRAFMEVRAFGTDAFVESVVTSLRAERHGS